MIMLIRIKRLIYLIIPFLISCTYEINPECNISSSKDESITSFISNKCLPCHAENNTPPNLSEIAGIKGNIDSIWVRINREPTQSGFMPENGTKLTECELDSIEEWKKTLFD